MAFISGSANTEHSPSISLFLGFDPSVLCAHNCWNLEQAGERGSANALRGNFEPFSPRIFHVFRKVIVSVLYFKMVIYDHSHRMLSASLPSVQVWQVRQVQQLGKIPMLERSTAYFQAYFLVAATFCLLPTHGLILWSGLSHSAHVTSTEFDCSEVSEVFTHYSRFVVFLTRRGILRKLQWRRPCLSRCPSACVWSLADVDTRAGSDRSQWRKEDERW